MIFLEAACLKDIGSVYNYEEAIININQVGFLINQIPYTDDLIGFLSQMVTFEEKNRLDSSKLLNILE